MRVMIAGAGEIGWYVAEQISQAGHDVTIIDNNENRVRMVDSTLDVSVIQGTATSASILTKAGVADTDLFVALTGSDDTNLVSASVARKLGAGRSVARIDEVVYRKAPEISYQQHFGIDELLSPEMLTALELASIVRNPGTLAVEHFARGAIEMQQVVADRGAEFVGQPLYRLDLPDDVRIASIQRGSTLIIPKGNDIVDHLDQIILIGNTEKMARCRSRFETDKPSHQKVIIMGGGHTALSLARRLRSFVFRLTIIERRGERCKTLATSLPNATILNGDGTSLAFLKEERIENADFFISTTASDEANIMSAIQAKNLGVSNVLVVIHRPDYANLMEKIGIDRAISPRAVMAREILQMLSKDQTSTLATLDNGDVQILELPVLSDEFVGKKLRDITFPEETLILILQRDKDFFVPNAETSFNLNDTILVICRNRQRKKIVRMVTGAA